MSARRNKVQVAVHVVAFQDAKPNNNLLWLNVGGFGYLWEKPSDCNIGRSSVDGLLKFKTFGGRKRYTSLENTSFKFIAATDQLGEETALLLATSEAKC
jgi:hypothetical protein